MHDTVNTADTVDTVNRALTEAMRKQDRERLGPLRMLKAALVNRRVETGHALTDIEAQQVVESLIKQRRDAIDQFGLAGRDDLVQKERAEISVLETYLPPPADPAEIEQVVEAAISETGAASAKDFGRVMKVAMPKLAGRSVDGKAVSELVRRKLGH